MQTDLMVVGAISLMHLVILYMMDLSVYEWQVGRPMVSKVQEIRLVFGLLPDLEELQPLGMDLL